MKFPRLTKQKYVDIRSEIKNGDILIASGDYSISKLIQKATDSCWSHVAIVMRLDGLDRVMVLESIEDHGVRTLPLSEYIKNFEGTNRGYKGRLAIARHNEFEEMAKDVEKLKSMGQFAIDRFGRPYDKEEIARITIRIVGKFIGIKRGDMRRDEEYICSEYVYECFKCMGINVPYDKLGFIAPSHFASDENIELLWELEVNKG
jgi:hypothetical protein